MEKTEVETDGLGNDPKIETVVVEVSKRAGIVIENGTVVVEASNEVGIVKDLAKEETANDLAESTVGKGKIKT